MIVVATAAITRADEIYFLHKLLINDSLESAGAMDPATAGPGSVVVRNVPLLENAEFEKTVAKYLGRPISAELLNGLKNDIVKFAQTHDRQVVSVDIPNQNVSTGALRLGVVVLRYNQLAIRGNRYFSKKILEERLGIKPGDEVKLSSLEDAVAWVNVNPFRKVQVLVNKLPNTPGKADLIVGVEDTPPYKVAASYDDSGNAILGRNHYTGSVQFGNVFGADQMAGYQYSTTDKIRNYQAHSLDYRVPLRWRHFLQFTAAYVESNPLLADGLFEQKGRTYLADARYTMPIRGGDEPIELYGGLDFKRTNNNLEFGGDQVLNTSVDTFQAVVGGSMLKRDQKGGWFFAGSVSASPGGVNSRNKTGLFQTIRPKSSASYVYGSVAVQRLLTLSHDWSLFSRVNAQVASTNLLVNEQLSIGGVNTVRGYDPNVFNGDYGYVFANDLQTPVWKHQVPFLKKTSDPLETRLTLFYDTAQVYTVHRIPLVNSIGQQVGWDDQLLRPIGSAGVGLRMNVGTNFALTFDYGWHTTNLPSTRQHGRGHVKVVLAF